MISVLTPEESKELDALHPLVLELNATSEQLGKYWFLRHEQFARAMRLLASSDPTATLPSDERKNLKRWALVQGFHWYSLAEHKDGNLTAFEADWIAKAKGGWPTNHDLTKSCAKRAESLHEHISDEQAERLASLLLKANKTDESVMAFVGYYECLKQEVEKKKKLRKDSLTPALNDFRSQTAAIKKRLETCLAEKKFDEVKRLFEEAAQLAKDFKAKLPKEETGAFLIEVANNYMDLHIAVGQDYKRHLEEAIQQMKKLHSPK